RRSWTTLSPMVTSTRMVRDYTTDYYRPTQHQATLIAKPKDAGSYASWLETVKSEWSTVALSNLRVADTAAGGETHADTEAETLITVDVDPGSLRDKDIRVQAVVGDQDDHGQIVDPVIYDMEKTGKTTYTVAIHRDLPGTVGYTARVVPCHEMLVNAAETGLITYYHA